MPGFECWIVIALVGLLFFGKRLPEVGKSVAGAIVNFKKGLKDAQEEIERPGDTPRAALRRKPRRPPVDAKFDPYTGKPIEAPKFDPYTGKPINAGETVVSHGEPARNRPRQTATKSRRQGTSTGEACFTRFLAGVPSEPNDTGGDSPPAKTGEAGMLRPVLFLLSRSSVCPVGSGVSQERNFVIAIDEAELLQSTRFRYTPRVRNLRRFTPCDVSLPLQSWRSD